MSRSFKKHPVIHNAINNGYVNWRKITSKAHRRIEKAFIAQLIVEDPVTGNISVNDDAEIKLPRSTKESSSIWDSPGDGKQWVKPDELNTPAWKTLNK